MITLGFSAILFVIIAVSVSFILDVLFIKLFDKIFWDKTIWLLLIELLIFISIPLFTVYRCYIYMDNTIVKKAAFETKTTGTIIAITNEAITFTDNETGEITNIDYDMDYKIRPKIDKSLNSGEVKIITHSSDWGSYKEVTYNLPRQE